jgi:hypothetical protein
MGELLRAVPGPRPFLPGQILNRSVLDRQMLLQQGSQCYPLRIVSGSSSMAMELVLILGMMLTAAGILVGLYLPVLASHFVTPEKIRLYAIIGAALVVFGTAIEIFALWPIEVEIDQQSSSD